MTVRHSGNALGRTEFPVFIQRTDYMMTTKKGVPDPGSGLYDVRGVDPAAATIIEQLQPYHRGNDYRDDPLWGLHEMWLADKHRLPPLTITAAVAHDTRFPKGISRGFTTNAAFDFEHGAEVLRIEPAPDPETPYVEVEIDFAYAMAIAGVGPRLLRFPHVLQTYCAYARNTVRSLEAFAQ